MSEFNHKNASLADALRLIGEIDHLRYHAIIASANTEDEPLPYQVLAAQCQRARRNVQKQYFPDLEDKDWCMVKVAGHLMQLLEEMADGDIEEVKELKSLIDTTISIATGEDISGCSSCAIDKLSDDIA